MNAKKLNLRLGRKSLAFWFLIAMSYPQVLALQAQTQSPISTNQSDVVSVASRITDINTSVLGDRLNLKIDFASSDRPQVTYTRQGKAWVALLNGAQLQLGNGNASFTQANPVTGVSAIEATQYAPNKVRIRVTANNPEMFKDLVKRQDSPDGLIFSLEMQPTAATANTLTASSAPEAGVVNRENDPDRILIAQSNTNASVAQPLFEPKVTITSADGKTRPAQVIAQNTAPPPVANPVTPQLPGRVPGVVPPFRQLRTPPVGDIATTTSKLRADIVDLGTAERVPRITLKEAPAIEVLSLIGRIAGLSVVSAEAPAQSGAAAAPAAAGAATGLKLPVSLSIENETAQDVFNNVLRISGLEANRIGQTIFVATKLPVTLKNLVSKSYRLNQISVGEASAFLIGLGASRIVNRQRVIPGATTATVGTTASATVVTTPTESVPTLETVSITPESGATALLKGLQVIAEERGNSLTLIGSPRQVEFAEAQLARLDLRKRQVVINVKVVEVSLGNSLTGQTVSGNLTLNGGNPSFSTAGQVLGISLRSDAPITLPTSLLASITTSLNTGNAKILTDPSLTVQEGENASISLTEGVVTENLLTITPATGGSSVPTITQTTTVEDAGLSLNINIARVDDNGFINLSVSPSISAPGARIETGIGTTIGSFVIPLSKRTLNSGQIRLRDGQTLVLSGVIRDSERNVTTKVPILGDLPIIGALFRSDSNINTRSEVVIIVTPRIIDDSQDANWGYTYQPGAEVQKVLDSNQIKPQ
ncbi:MAG: hypothetical protein DCE90_05195 [Pseudanabaena sp.]|nr:MAG: hypothetical protein DCE90_05195 [Pseudanabaena sp.]